MGHGRLLPFRAACVQMRSGADIARNLEAASALIAEACGEGAELVVTPEMTNLIEKGRERMLEKTHSEADDPLVRAFAGLARERGIHLIAGSVALKAGPDRLVNRSLLFTPEGRIAQRYDKMHMFDVDLEGGESYRESRTYLAGNEAVLADLPWGRLGMTVCYDLRFPALYRLLAKAGADFLTVPSAFTRQTGEAHWHVLLRARAIETGSFVLAPAQGGRHESGRETYGHSLIVGPWGEVLAEAPGEEPGVIVAEIDRAQAGRARERIPALSHDRSFAVPEAEPQARAAS